MVVVPGVVIGCNLSSEVSRLESCILGISTFFLLCLTEFIKILSLTVEEKFIGKLILYHLVVSFLYAALAMFALCFIYIHDSRVCKIGMAVCGTGFSLLAEVFVFKMINKEFY